MKNRVVLFLILTLIISCSQKGENNFQQKSDEKQDITKVKEEVLIEEEEKLKELVSSKLKEGYWGVAPSMSDPTLKEVEVTADSNGQRHLVIEFNSDGSGREYLKGNIEEKMSILYFHLYHKTPIGVDIGSVTIKAYHLLSDKYGNESNQVVYKTSLSSNEANKINWDADEIDLKISIIQKVWTTDYIHPILR